METDDSLIILSESLQVNADSNVSADSVIDEKKSSEPEWGNNTFKNSQEALDFMSDSQDAAKYAAGIFPIMAEQNLLYLTKLLNSPYRRFIVVDKQSMKVVLFDKFGREEKRYGMACARNYGTKHKKADSRTPEGFFSVEGIYDSTDWLFTDDNGHTSKVKGQFGPRFIRLKIPVTSQIGIHGTGSPWSIGNRVSHGCIRITNDNILELVKKVEVGMPVIVSPSARDEKVNESEGYHIGYVSIDPTGTPRILKNVAAPKNSKSGTSITDSLDNSVIESTEKAQTNNSSAIVSVSDTI